MKSFTSRGVLEVLLRIIIHRRIFKKLYTRKVVLCGTSLNSAMAWKALFCMQTLIEKSQDFPKSVHILCFIDYNEAFDEM